MEKKPNSVRSNQTLSKGLIAESRKNQDVSTKQWPRNGRRRESSNYSNNTKSESQIRSANKQAALRTGFDKRVRQHGDGYQRSVGPAEALSETAPYTGLDDTDDTSFVVELNSVYTPGSKKQNLNHLLNFHYTPRERTDPLHFTRAGNAHRMHAMKKSKYNKEHFLQATCQFVVNAEFDYEPYTVCPDTLVEWTNIEQVIVQSAEEPQCPICLYPPVAAKMTRCGHVYCWPCILQYLSLSDKPWRKCPICYESVHAAHLKSTVSKPHPIYNVGDFVTLQLMCREKGSLYVSKINKTKTNNFPHLFGDAEDMLHSKLILANVDEIMTIVERERTELNCQLQFDGLDCPESIFIQQALILLNEREEQMKSMTKHQHPNSSNLLTVEQKLDQLNLNINAKPFVPIGQQQADANDGEESSDKQQLAATAAPQTANYIIDEETNLTLHDIDIQPTVKDSNNFYFYQATDGQHLYLHSVNVRQLQMMYGCLDRAPHQIRGRIVQKESCSMSEDLRKRLKYLQHLPVTSQFDVVEIVMDPGILSVEVLAIFKDELMLRQKTRQRRVREEIKREKHINEVNDRQIGKILARSANIDVTSDRQFPLCGSFDSQASYSRDDPSFVALSPGEYSPPGGGGSSSAAAAGLSFATMLTTGQTKVELWPTLGPTKSLTFDTASGGTSSMAANRGSIVQSNQSLNDSDNVDDDSDVGAKVPEFRSSFGTAIAAALISKPKGRNGVKDAMVTATVSTAGGNGGGKKKKNKKTVLFSTSARPFDGK